MLKGDAVYNLTVMFLAMWNATTQKTDDFTQYRPQKNTKQMVLYSHFTTIPLMTKLLAKQFMHQNLALTCD
ncbi:MAG: hypothetical protein R3Y67_07935 [Eubacteriales bacterium]